VAVAGRTDRLFAPTPQDQRSAFQRDRDRILYCSAFRRLEGITQVASVEEGLLFHNRLTHSLKVAQIGLRLGQWLCSDPKSSALASQHSIDPDVVEAAGLAHDIGHPPFGHVGESKLDELVQAASDPDGFEGNAQTFRVLTKLALRFADVDGLDLTRATLSSSMKYPWFRDLADKKKKRKWSAYRCDKQAFDFARAGLPDDLQTAEAALMDWADDIAYSVHDIEDFHRANLIPWALIFTSSNEKAAIVADAVKTWWDAPSDAKQRLERALERILDLARVAKLEQVYNGSRDDRVQLRWWTSELISRYLLAVSLTADQRAPVTIDPMRKDEVLVLKRFTWRYVIEKPSLAAQQFGFQRVIGNLFEDLMLAVQKKEYAGTLPARYRHLADDTSLSPARIVADCIAGLTEPEALALHHRLRGTSPGTVLNPIVR
jgi:dGTPase